MHHGYSTAYGHRLFEGLTVAHEDEEREAEPTQMRDPHRELVLRILRRIPIHHERGTKGHHPVRQSRIHQPGDSSRGDQVGTDEDVGQTASTRCTDHGGW